MASGWTGIDGPRWTSLAAGLLLATHIALPARTAAQDLGWTAAAAVFVDASQTFETPVGPGLTGEVELRRERDLSLAGILTVARTDINIGLDDGHQNLGAVALAARWMRESEKPSVGFILGLGGIFWDVVNETTPELSGSADGAGLLLPGVEVRIPTADSYGVTVSVRDAITGLLNAIVDPSERNIEHRFLISVGIYRR